MEHPCVYTSFFKVVSYFSPVTLFTKVHFPESCHTSILSPLSPSLFKDSVTTPGFQTSYLFSNDPLLPSLLTRTVSLVVHRSTKEPYCPYSPTLSTPSNSLRPLHSTTLARSLTYPGRPSPSEEQWVVAKITSSCTSLNVKYFR